MLTPFDHVTQGTHSFLLPKNTPVNDVAQDWLRKEVKLAEGGSGQIRIFEIARGCLQKPFAGTEMVRDVQDSTELFAEEVPVDEAKAVASDDGSARVVPVYHYNKEPTRAHGVPFNFVLLPVRCGTASLASMARLLTLLLALDRARGSPTPRSDCRRARARATRIWPR